MDDERQDSLCTQPNWWVYILQCGDGTLYTGIAMDIDERLAKHQAGKGAKYTRGRGPLMVVHREFVGGKGAAVRRESAIKRLSRSGKMRLIKGQGTPLP